MGTEVKFFGSAFGTGAPSLTGQAGQGLAVLDAVLVNGYGLGTVDSLVIAGGVGTVTRAAGHSAFVDGVQLLAGITGTYVGLNGERRVLSVTSNTWTFDATGSPDGTAAGTITSKVAPLGYTKPFSGTNLAVYRSSDGASLGFYLRVDDSGTASMRLVSYETMSDVNAGTGANQPTSGGGHWAKSNTADATARPWFIIGDSRGFYWWSEPNVTTASGVTSQGVLFGNTDLIPRRSSDAYASLFASDTAANTAATGTIRDLRWSSVEQQASYRCQRSQTGLGSAQYMNLYCAARKFHPTASRSGAGLQFFPNAADNGLDLEDVLFGDFESNSIRGRAPGLYHTVQNDVFAFGSYDKINGQGSLAGRKLMSIRCGQPGYTTQNSGSGEYAVVFFDITGPWR